MLRGEKVILRAVEREDLKRLHQLEGDVELMLLGDGDWQPTPFAAAEKRFDKYLDSDEKNWFVIEVNGTVIGSIGLHRIERRDGTAQLGISIYDREYLSQGYGRDAINVLLDWAFRIRNYRRIWLDTLANNERAIRSYRACGFVEEGRLRRHFYHNGEYVDAVLMGILREEWDARVRAK